MSARASIQRRIGLEQLYESLEAQSGNPKTFGESELGMKLREAILCVGSMVDYEMQGAEFLYHTERVKFNRLSLEIQSLLPT